MTKTQARRSIGTAEALDAMPAVRDALQQGKVSFANASALAGAAERTSAEQVNSDPALLQQAATAPADSFAKSADAWAQSRQHDNGLGDYLRSRSRRSLRFWEQDGMTHLRGRFDRETGARLRNRIEQQAEQLRRDKPATTTETEPGPEQARDTAGRTEPGFEQTTWASNGTEPGFEQTTGASEDRPSFEQACADALDMLTTSRGTAAGSSGSGQPKADVIAVVDVGVLTGNDPNGCCEIPGTGPIAPEVLERICCNADITPVLLDGKGTVLRHGETVRAATKAQWQALVARDRGCVGCGAAPSRCEAHHIIDFARTRHTHIEELTLVCWQCHRLIHDHNWRIDTTSPKPTLQPPDPAIPKPPNPWRYNSHARNQPTSRPGKPPPKRSRMSQQPQQPQPPDRPSPDSYQQPALC